jgi:hypothetical protein
MQDGSVGLTHHDESNYGRGTWHFCRCYRNLGRNVGWC